MSKEGKEWECQKRVVVIKRKQEEAKRGVGDWSMRDEGFICE